MTDVPVVAAVAAAVAVAEGLMNSFGTKFRLTSFGESHGVAIGGVIDGCPAGLLFDKDLVIHRLALRSPRSVPGATSRCEADDIEFLSGIFDGYTLGTPIAFIVRNADARSKDYDGLKNIFRPGHADFSWQTKYGMRDYRGGGRASARETVARVVAGAVASMWLEKQGVDIIASTDSIGAVSIGKALDYAPQREQVETDPLRCADPEVSRLMDREIRAAAADNDSVGGAVRCIIKGVPPGIGDPVFGKLQSDLAAAMMSIPAAKGFEYGQGMAVARMRASESNDEMRMVDGKPVFLTNRAGGLLGGISTGEDIFFRVAFKPTPSVGRLQRSVTVTGDDVEVKIFGRHDVCVVPRAVAVVEAMASLVIINKML